MFKRHVDRTCKLSRQNNTRLQISTSASNHLPVHRIFLKVWHYKHSLNKVHREPKLMILHAKNSQRVSAPMSMSKYRNLATKRQRANIRKRSWRTYRRFIMFLFILALFTLPVEFKLNFFSLFDYLQFSKCSFII